MKKYLFIFSLIVSFFFITKVNAATVSDFYGHNNFDAENVSFSTNYNGSWSNLSYAHWTANTPMLGYTFVTGSVGTARFRFSFKRDLNLHHSYNINFLIASSTKATNLDCASYGFVGTCSLSYIGNETVFFNSSQEWINYHIYSAYFSFTYDFDNYPDVFALGFNNQLTGYLYSLDLYDNGYTSDYLENTFNSQGDINSARDEIISNQNSNSQAEMEQAQKNHDDMMNADADSALKDKDTSAVDDYNKAEQDMMSKIDVDTSSLTFDINSYSKPFSWIWDNVTTLFNVNPKIMGCVISVLVLSFVSLLIGRG